MPIARNKHASHVGGLAPGAVGMISEEVAAKYPWAFAIVPTPLPPPPPPLGSSYEIKASDAIEQIRESDNREFIESFLSDGRSSVRDRAVARLRRLS